MRAASDAEIRLEKLVEDSFLIDNVNQFRVNFL